MGIVDDFLNPEYFSLDHPSGSGIDMLRFFFYYGFDFAEIFVTACKIVTLKTLN